MHYLLPFLLVLLAAAMTSAAEKPNVLFIAVDDLNHWVGYTGRNPQTQTPNLDRLAGMGTAFTQAHCAVPACNPSRAALMSGMRASTTGCYFNQDFWTRFIPEGKTMAATFKQAGYSTWGMGKIFHSDSFY
ncbi:MAG: sulfatase-like hydrolase/transferase, partial [Verrucomicrobiae bacterium]|nr:sulfatase-like hydrolase/transferase [Verrucomicrobiae bacterium]